MANQNLDKFFNFAAAQYGYDPNVIREVARLESGFNPKAVNNSGINAKNGTPPRGMFQFIDPTFKAFSRQAKQANPAAWKNIPTNSNDWRAQALTFAWAAKNGKGGHWATFDRAKQAAQNSQPVNKSANIPQTTQASQPLSGGIDKKALALQMVFKDNPRMQNLLNYKTVYDQRKQKTFDPYTDTPQQVAALDANNPFSSVEKMFGLKQSSSDNDARGVHTENSFHYQKTPHGVRAYDYGDAKNNPATLKKLAAYLKQNPSRVKEFFYDPLGWYIDNGKIVKGSIGGHGDHAHLAF